MVSDKAWEAANKTRRVSAVTWRSQIHETCPASTSFEVYRKSPNPALREKDRLRNDVLVNGPRFVSSTEAVCYRCSSCRVRSASGSA